MTWRALAYAALCALSAGCTVVVYQHDDFPYQLRRGCGSVDDCDRLVTEAKARVAKCGPGSSARVPCPDANADLATATDLARAKRADEQEKSRQRGLKDQSDERRQRDEHDVTSQQKAESQDHANVNNGDAAARAREDEARRQREAAQARQNQAADKANQQNAFKQDLQDAAKRAQQAEAERKAHEAEEAEREQQREHQQKKSP